MWGRAVCCRWRSSLICVAALLVVTSGGACGGSSEAPSTLGASADPPKQSAVHAASDRTASTQGVALAVPRRWYGRTDTRRTSRRGPLLAWIQVSNVRAVRDAPLQAGGIVITLTELAREEYREPPPEPAGRPRICRSDFVSPSSPRVPAGESLAMRSFSISGRPFGLEVAFGRLRARTFSIKTVNRVLASLSVRPR